MAERWESTWAPARPHRLNITPNIGTVRPKKDWTVLYVLDGDNDLREAATMDLVELHHAGAPGNAHVVAQLHRGELSWTAKNLPKKLSGLFRPELPPAVQPDWRGVRVYEVQPEGPTVMVEDAPESVSPSDPTSLENFLAWGMKEYPAEHYAVVLGGHGSRKGLLSDSKGDVMPFEKVSESLQRAAAKSGEDIDVVLFDSCSTASPETAEKMCGATDFLVATPFKTRGQGWSEKATMNFLKENPKATPLDLTQSFLSGEHAAVKSPVFYDLRAFHQ